MDFFLEHLELINRLLARLARRHAMSADDAEEFAAWARARLLDNDCAILRKFEGRSSAATFLTVVVSNLLHDWRNAKWGRWRPSAAACRMGPLGIRLEELLVRDGYSLREATEILRSAGYTGTDGELRRMAAKLPSLRNLGDVTLDDAPELADSSSAADALTAEQWERVKEVIRKTLEQLPAEDRIIMRMRHWDGLTVAKIARILHLEQKPLYRRIEAIERRLRELLLEQGVTDEIARDLLAEEGLW